MKADKKLRSHLIFHHLRSRIFTQEKHREFRRSSAKTPGIKFAICESKHMLEFLWLPESGKTVQSLNFRQSFSSIPLLNGSSAF